MAEEKKEQESGGDLIEFFGTECQHCEEMKPLVAKLEQEEGLTLDKKEVWHNAGNQALFMKLAEGKCSGIPFFFNKKTGKYICGKASYEKFKAWALGEE